ncbi:helix-turn-helix domain-containing protein [Pseudoxanthomonas mexicana]|uniref:helix-turn-helix domain-containing protein n=1 Tax=Pseudoxanthomonas mexicana TaxID=128785 RepID=UPI00398A651F
MSIVATLLDKARARKGITSDNALGAHLKTNRQVISQWRHGDSYPSEENIAELAEMAGDDPVQWLVAIKAVRADGKAGKAWSALAKRLAATAAALMILLTFPTAKAGISLANQAVTKSEFGYSVYYVKTETILLRRLPGPGNSYCKL